MRGKKLIAALVAALGVATFTPTAFAKTGFCFTADREGAVAKSLMSQQDVRAYVFANYRLFENIGVDACLDKKNGLHVTAKWLRAALPPSAALKKILSSSKVHGFKPWSLLLALDAHVVAVQAR